MDYYDIFGNNSVFVGDHERNPPNQFVSKHGTLIPMVFYTYMSWSSTLICQGTSLVVPGHTSFTSFTSRNFFSKQTPDNISNTKQKIPSCSQPKKKDFKKHVQFLQESLITAVQSINQSRSLGDTHFVAFNLLQASAWIIWLSKPCFSTFLTKEMSLPRFFRDLALCWTGRIVRVNSRCYQPVCMDFLRLGKMKIIDSKKYLWEVIQLMFQKFRREN